jgi:hypothetical protein
LLIYYFGYVPCFGYQDKTFKTLWLLFGIFNMFRNGIYITTIALIQFSLSAFAGDYKTYRDYSDGVTFDYPLNWNIQSQRTAAFRVVIAPSGPLGGTCMLSTTQIPSLAKYSDLQVRNMTTEKMLEDKARLSGLDFSITELKRVYIGNRPAIIYSARSAYNEQIPMTITFGQVKVSDKFYELGCTADSYSTERLKGIFLKIIYSLTIKYN